MTAETRIRGVCPVLAVPFTAHGDIDLAGFEALTRHVLGTGVTALVLFGFAGEFYKLRDDERAQLRRTFLRETSGRTEVAAIVSITDHATEVAVARSEEHTSELQSPCNLVCRLLLEKKKKH